MTTIAEMSVVDLEKAESLPCSCCKGSGVRESKGFTALDGTVYPDRSYKCAACDGTGTFSRVDFPAILTAILNSRTKKLKASKPKTGGPRAYYVWRMARFHGGKDLRMPVCATLDVYGDPYVKILDAFADAVAKVSFGTDMAAAFRWRNAMGYQDDIPAGLPASAYPGGPEVML